MTIFLFYSALVLCAVTAISLMIALVSIVTKKPGIERSIGVVALISTVISFLIYYYLRIILSGGGLSDWRVVFVVTVYAVACILSASSIVDGSGKLKKNL